MLPKFFLNALKMFKGKRYFMRGAAQPNFGKGDVRGRGEGSKGFKINCFFFAFFILLSFLLFCYSFIFPWAIFSVFRAPVMTLTGIDVKAGRLTDNGVDTEGFLGVSPTPTSWGKKSFLELLRSFLTISSKFPF